MTHSSPTAAVARFLLGLLVDAVRVAFPAFVGRLAARCVDRFMRQAVRPRCLCRWIQNLGFSGDSTVAVLGQGGRCPCCACRSGSSKSFTCPFVWNDRCRGHVPQLQLSYKVVFTPVVAQSLIPVAWQTIEILLLPYAWRSMSFLCWSFGAGYGGDRRAPTVAVRGENRD